MDDPILNAEDREAINSGRWFSSLSPALRHDILRCAFVKRFKNGELISARGDAPEEWISCARGAIRVSSTSITGKQITLTYIEPGLWVGDVAIFDGERRTHDSYAHGDSTLLCVPRFDLRKILSQHVELYEALPRLNARRIRQLFGLVEDLNTLPPACTAGQTAAEPDAQLWRTQPEQQPGSPEWPPAGAGRACPAAGRIAAARQPGTLVHGMRRGHPGCGGGPGGAQPRHPA